MAQHKPTPEEQLLKLIENPSEHPKGDVAKKEYRPQGGDKGPKKTGLGAFTKTWFAFGKDRAGKKKTAKPATALPVFSIKLANRMLLILTMAAGLYLVLDLFVLKQDDADFLAQVSITDVVFSVDEASLGPSGRDLGYYQKHLKRRNPFLPPEVEIAEKKEATVSALLTQSSGMSKILQTLELVGISWSDREPLAMIEDTTSGRTYFLGRGQKVKGIKIQSVSKDKVIVTYEGEEATLL